MPVEYLNNGTWTLIPNATASHRESNHWLVSITGLPVSVRLTAFDGAALRFNGHETFNVWGTNKTGGTLILECLVR